MRTKVNSYRSVIFLISFITLAAMLVSCASRDNSSSSTDQKRGELSSLSETEIIDKIEKENQTGTLLNQQKFFGAAITRFNYREKTLSSESVFINYDNGNFSGSYTDDKQKILYFTSDKVYHYNDSEHTFSQQIFFDNQYEEAKNSVQKCYRFLSGPNEKVVSIKKTGDFILVQTKYNIADESNSLKTDYNISNGVITITYSVDPNTFFIKRKEATCLLDSGVEEKLFDTSIYQPEDSSTTTKTMADALPKGERTITAVFNLKTKKIYKVKSGLKITFDLPKGYKNAYRDEACTSVYHSAATKNDETIYFVLGK